MKLSSGVVSFTFLTLMASPSTSLDQEDQDSREACELWKECREEHKMRGMDSRPKYDMTSEDDDFAIGEFGCLLDDHCEDERKKFCSEHQDDGSQFVKRACAAWAKKGYDVDVHYEIYKD